VTLFPRDTERLKRFSYKGKEIILADYSGLKEMEMIALTNRHRDLVVQEGKESLFVANYENTYGTAGYMKAAHEFTKATKPFISRGAFLGVTGPKVALLKGVTYFLKVDFKSFDNEQDALDFLVP
jgi:hypothetical protein